VRIIGLTGGIASGKSTVAGMFRELGAAVIDADALAREAVEPGSATLEAIDRRFPGTVSVEGVLDRSALGARVFGDAAEREALDALVHPRVRALYEARLRALEAAGTPLAVYDVPLLYETGLEGQVDAVVVVTVPESVQLNRLQARSGLDAQAAVARVRSQLPLEEKARRATYRVDNSGSLSETERQVREIWRALQAAS